MQKHGLIVADNGSDMYITGTFDTRWNNDILNPAFATLSASDFEVIALGLETAGRGRRRSPRSASIRATVVGGNAATGTVTLTAAAPAGGALVALASASGAVSVPATVTIPAGAASATFRHRDVGRVGADDRRPRCRPPTAA